MDVWSTLADFCNILTAVNQSEVPLYKDPDDDLTLLILEEDRLLSGFVPLLAAPQDPCYVEKSVLFQSTYGESGVEKLSIQ